MASLHYHAIFISLLSSHYVAMSKGRNVTFNAMTDHELLDGMYEQIMLGCKADRDFKGEAYEVVTAGMTANSNGKYVLTKLMCSN